MKALKKSPAATPGAFNKRRDERKKLSKNGLSLMTDSNIKMNCEALVNSWCLYHGILHGITEVYSGLSCIYEPSALVCRTLCSSLNPRFPGPAPNSCIQNQGRNPPQTG